MVGRLIASNARPQGGDDSNLPPPSTIAAQLVKNHAEYARGNRQTDDSATFGQLLQEILNKTSAPENDVGVNHKLIQVVVEAGLDVLFQDNPFTQSDVLLTQAVDSLAVIEATIRRQPKVLLFEGPRLTQSQQQPHLLIWLLSKVLSLISHPKGSDLHDRLSSLLQCMVESTSKTLGQWQYSHALLDVFRDCATELMVALSTDLFFAHLTVMEVKLPPVRSLTSLWSEAQYAVALPPGCQTPIRDATSGFQVMLLLISAIMEMSNPENVSMRLEAVLRIFLGQMLDMVPSLLHCLLEHRQHFEQHQQFETLSARILHLYGRAMNMKRQSMRTGTREPSQYTTVRFFQSCSEYILASCKQPLPAHVQHSIGVTVQDIVGAPSMYLEAIVEESLLPAFHSFASDEMRFQTCEATLRSAMYICLSKSSQALPDWVRAVPDQQGDTAMEDMPVSRPLIESHVVKATPTRLHSLRTARDHRLRDHVHSLGLYDVLLNQAVDLLSKGDGSGVSKMKNIAACVKLSSFECMAEANRRQ